MPATDAPPHRGSAAEVFTAFLRLGLMSFGGPLAHVAYFRHEFVMRRRWLDEAAFAQLLTLCQALPGPTSSQLGFALGQQRAGWRGALSAFAGFTLPSAALMFALALHVPMLLGSLSGTAVLHGLKLLAVVVVAQGVGGMARQLLPDSKHWLVAATAAAIVLVGHGIAWQLLAIGVGALAGLGLAAAPAPSRPSSRRVPARAAWSCGLLFLLGLGLSALSGARPSPANLAGAAWRAGALVFGGGHVVLPLLEAPFVGQGWMSGERFLAGYGAAQAMPGPMFSIGAYLGASVLGVAPWLGATVTLLCLFAPGLLLVAAALPFWQTWLARPRWAGVAAGVNAAAVGLLAAALCGVLLPQAVRGPIDAAIVVVGLVLVLPLRAHALWAVAWCVLAAFAAALCRTGPG